MEAPQNTESLQVSGEETFVSLKHECHSGGRTRDLRLARRSALTTVPGAHAFTSAFCVGTIFLFYVISIF